MSIIRLILNPITVATLVAMFLVLPLSLNISNGLMVDVAEAGHDKDKDKYKDKDKDDDDGFKFNLGNVEPYVSDPIDCTGLQRLQIIYHKDFKSTEEANGPNILVTGSDSNQCTITIEKTTGGNKCGFKLTKAGDKIKIETMPKGNEKNCEMCIKVVAPRTTHILG